MTTTWTCDGHQILCDGAIMGVDRRNGFEILSVSPNTQSCIVRRHGNCAVWSKQKMRVVLVPRRVQAQSSAPTKQSYSAVFVTDYHVLLHDQISNTLTMHDIGGREIAVLDKCPAGFMLGACNESRYAWGYADDRVWIFDWILRIWHALDDFLSARQYHDVTTYACKGLVIMDLINEENIVLRVADRQANLYFCWHNGAAIGRPTIHYRVGFNRQTRAVEIAL